jgi:predicted DNA repair protein MutK
MAAGGLLALLDDIAVLLDDIAVMSKAAATKTAGIVGDDLAVSSQALVGIDPKRELPIVWKVARGSLKNKFILVPAALFLSAFAEWAITPLLMLGGAFLCYEGAEKVIHAVKPTTEDKKHQKEIIAAAHAGAGALAEVEKKKIAEAVNTDFILSAEIVAVALGTVKEKSFAIQAGVLAGIGIGMTVVVYGLVGCIIKMDDVGMYLLKKKSRAAQKFGHGILKMMPYFMKTLSVVGTIAMFTVGGGILLHGTPPVAHAMHGWNGWLSALAATGAGAIAGLIIVPVAHKLGAPCAALAGKVKTKLKKKPKG